MRRIRLIVTCGLAASIVALAAILLPPALRDQSGAPPGRPGAARPLLDGRGDLAQAIEVAQERLRRLPGDWATWAQLGSAYVEQARVTADPTFYPKADGALDQSLRLRPDDNWQAMVGKGALANARHDFAAGLSWGRRAEQINAYSGSVHGVIVDALTQLGQYPQAHQALSRMLDVQPGLAAFTRASYDRELHGDQAGAADALRRALALASDPADRAFCLYYLGELAFNVGDPRTAMTQYRAAITADPRYQLSFAGLAKAEAALGQTANAIAEYDRVVRILPLPHLLIEYGDFLASLGRQAQAKAQYDLVEAEQALFADNGGSDHLLLATFLADHGRAREALDHARAEWDVRPTVQAADALAWALHRNGRDEEALEYLDIAGRLGWRNATFAYHRGVIRAALGDGEQARDDLADALATNVHFDILQAPIAQQLLSTLEDSR